MSNVNTNWENWKGFLSQAVEFAGELGIPEDKIVSLARQAGEVLAVTVEPVNPEQKVLRELWQVSDQQEKQVIAGLMTKLCTSTGSQLTGSSL